MLCLSRKKNERIVIGEGPDRIEIMVIEVSGDRCRLGIEADRSIPVHRYEVAQAIEREKRKEEAA